MADFIQPDELFPTAYEPKQKARYIMYVEGVPSFVVKVAARPTITFETMEINHINATRYVQGKGKWGTTALTLADPIVPSSAQAVMEWVRLSYESVTGAAGYHENYVKDITIKLLGPAGDIIEQWTGKNAFITEANFNDLDWSSASDPLDVSLTLQCDYWILEF